MLNAPDLLVPQARQDGKEVSREVVAHRLRPHRYPRAAQLADLGTGRLALRAQRRLQPQPRDQSGGQGLRLHLCAVADPPAHARIPGLLRGHQQSLWHRLGPRGQRHRQACHWANDHLFHFVETGYYQRQARAVSAVHDADRLDHRPQAPEDGLLRPRLLRQRRLPREVPRPALHGQHPRRLHQRRRLRRDGSTYLANGEPDFLTANDAWFMPVVAEDRPRRLPVRPRLVRPLPLLPGRQPRSRRASTG